MNKPARNALKTTLILLGSMLMLVVLLLVAIGTYMVYGSRQANQAAQAFCSTVKPGTDIDDAIAAAARNAYPNRSIGSDDRFLFVFQGGIFHAGTCKVDVRDGKVTAARFEVADD